MNIYKVNSFTHQKKGGNPAGVVLLDTLDRPLSVSQMQAVAKKVGFSETAFVSRADQDATEDFVVRFFTPTDEVPLCGHATVATFHVLNELKLLPKHHILQSTLAGQLAIEIEEGTKKVYMEQTLPTCDVLSSSFNEALPQIFGCSKEDLTCKYDAYSHQINLPIEIWDTGIRDVLMPIKNRASLNALEINFNALSTLSIAENVCGVHAFTYDDGQIYARNFAPSVGIDEESATGTSNGALVAYLFHHIRANGFSKIKSLELSILQGEAMNQLSEINAKCTLLESNQCQIWVGGFAQIVEILNVPLEDF